MTKTYYSVLTQHGEQLITSAIANKKPLQLLKMAIGDGNGQAVTPTREATKLAKQVYSNNVSAISVDPRNHQQVIFELLIPETEGGFWIREIGLFDNNDKLVAYANCPESFKPQLSSGSGKVQIIRLILAVSSSDAVELKIDNDVIFAKTGQLQPKTINGNSQNKIDEDGHTHEITKASTSQQGIVQLTNEITSNSETLALTAKAGKELAKKIEEYIPKNQKSDLTNSDSSDTVATSKAVKTAYDKAEEARKLAESKQSPETTLAGYGITDFQVKAGSDDLNDYKTDGHYYFASGQHLPDNGAWHVEVVSGGQTTAVRQIARKANDTGVKTRFFNGSNWTEWKAVGGDGVPLGAIVAFPKAITNPTGFLKCDGSEINQQTYPDLYRTLSEKTQVEGNKKRLPNLTRSDVGMTAYFATDKIPEGWIAFDEIKEKVKEDTYPELYQYLIKQYKDINHVPKAEDRFLRNTGNNLTVGMTQLGSLIGADSTDGNGAFSPYVKAIQSTYQETVDQVGFDPLLTEDIGNGITAVNNEHSPDSGQPETKKQYNAGLSWSVGTDRNEDLNQPIQNNDTGNGHFVGVTRPKSLVLKLCIKAKSSFDEVVFWIKAFGAVENQGVLDVSSLAQEVQEYKQMSVNVDGKLDDIMDKVDDALEVINTPVTVWTGNQSQGNKITLSEPCFDSTIILYLQHSTSNNLNDTSEIEVVSFDMCSEIKDKDIKNRGQAKDGYCYKLHKQHNEYGSFYLYVDHTGKQITLSRLNNRLCKRIDLRY
ncbi:phage tail-collar fiber domain-containing protein [Histophilus somni]|uniref:phage tail-collar fiber domain-containing protein n=1 Tax=Histophilus somni TaxID=731 RepID=UPI00201F3EDA|nr:phage tail protein [Histophilus somni]